MVVNLLQESSEIGIVDEPVGFFLDSEIGSPLRDLLDSETLPPVGLHLILGSLPGSKIRYPDLVVSPSKATLVVPSSGSCSNFLLPPSGMCPNYPLQSMLVVNLSGV